MRHCYSPKLVPLVALAAALAGCATKPATVVAPPLVVIPPQPRPPVGAPSNLAIPPADAFGGRLTINSGISPVQTVWNLRSAYNVAALNCLQPRHAPILDGYKKFLTTNAARLRSVNRDVDKEFRAKHGAGYVRAREAYMTQVYNYYALPPTLPAFCDATLAMVLENTALPPRDLDTYAAPALRSLDAVFFKFYDSYEQYRADLTAWRQRYAPASAVAVPAMTLPAASAPHSGWGQSQLALPSAMPLR